MQETFPWSDPAAMPSVTLLWLRRDLRLADNAALEAARRRGAVVPIFVWNPDEEAPWQPGAAARVWLHESLRRMSADLETAGSRLIVRSGDTLDTLRRIARETRADAVHWNRLCDPTTIPRDERVKAALTADGLHAQSFNSALLFEPWTIRTGAGEPYRVFTPFWKACLAAAQRTPPAPGGRPRRIPAPEVWPPSEPLDSLRLCPRIPWDAGIREAWHFGEKAAWERQDRFSESGLGTYDDHRDRPGLDGTSRLSPALHWGQIGPRQVWAAVQERLESSPSPAWAHSAWSYLRQLVWREFAHHLLFHFPATAQAPLRAGWKAFPWREDPAALHAWQRGETGYPIVDAGLRQLWATGWMHNRVRMIVASFLTKDLLIPWQHGARWFWDTLVDADLANNTLGWQWTAGCGADAAPFFRIFNPVSQGQKFDPTGAYVRQWVPELAPLPAEFIHRPWEAPATLLRSAGVALGKTYPRRIIDHAHARDRALRAYERMRTAM